MKSPSVTIVSVVGSIVAISLSWILRVFLKISSELAVGIAWVCLIVLIFKLPAKEKESKK